MASPDGEIVVAVPLDDAESAWLALACGQLLEVDASLTLSARDVHAGGILLDLSGRDHLDERAATLAIRTPRTWNSLGVLDSSG